MNIDFIIMMAPWLFFIGLALIGTLLLKFARKRKGIAMALGILLQMVLPDPFVEKAIAMVVSEKKEVKKQQQQDGDKPKSLH
jgi:hypothetical protein